MWWSFCVFAVTLDKLGIDMSSLTDTSVARYTTKCEEAKLQ